MFWRKCKTFVLAHKWDLTIHAYIVCALLPCGTIGSAWRKSPPIIITFYPNRASQYRASFNVWSNASKAYLFVMGASSQMIVVVSIIRLARSYCLLIEQMDSSLNRECAILPPGNSVAAISDATVAKTIWPVLLNFFNESVIKEYLTRSSYPSTKKIRLRLHWITFIMVL